MTLLHFQEIDRSDVLFALLSKGYIGYSVAIEITYAYARKKRIVASEQPDEYAVRPMIDRICNADDFISQVQSEWKINCDLSNGKTK